MKSRRAFLRTGLGVAASAPFTPSFVLAAPRSAAAAAAQAHSEIWRRFIDAQGVMLDFTDLDGSVDLPTPEECREGMPNALGWWSPIENGAMFGGSYLEMMVNRWEQTRSEADAEKARRLVKGLLLLNSISDVPGFIGRGVSTDGRSHFAMGSDDQTIPWFLGLWRFWRSGIASDDERQRIRRHFETTASALVKLNWLMPAEPPFGTRGSFAGFEFDAALRKLFILRAMADVTDVPVWGERYRAALSERGGEEKLSRVEIAERGLTFWYSKRHNWTSASSVGCLRALWDLEIDPGLKAVFASGLASSVKVAAEAFPMALRYDSKETKAFAVDWRASMLPLWKPQTTAKEAQAVAGPQLRAFGKASPQRGRETAFVREPAAAAWIVSLCPDPEVVRPHAAEIKAIIARYDYARLYYSTFFWLEGAWWRLKERGL